MRNGLASANYPYTQSVLFPINCNENNLHLNVSAVGDEITARAWKVYALNGAVVETPIVLNPGAENEYIIKLIDTMFQSGTAGLQACTACNNSIFF